MTTTLALDNQDNVQTEEQTRYTRFKKMAQRYLDQVTKDRNFVDRNDKAANAATIRRTSEDTSKNEERKSQYVRQWLTKGKCSSGESCSFKHDISMKGKGKSRRDRPSSQSLEPRSQSKDSKEEKVQLKEKSTAKHQTRNRHAIFGIRPHVSNIRRMKVANDDKELEI